MKKKHFVKARKLVILILFLALALYIGMNFYNPLRTVKYDFYSDKISEDFEGFRIVQLTDFHCREFGDKEEELISEVAAANPDIIVLTGDFIDEYHSVENCEYLFEGITKIAPVYFVTGNHEYKMAAPVFKLLDLIDKYDIKLLNHDTIEIERNNSKILLTGVNYTTRYDDLINKLGPPNTDYFNLLLIHGSDDFPVIAFLNYDLILSGHGHGGVIRLPFIGGLLGNDGDFFPKYDYGKFTIGSSTMISSSGLGDSQVPRFNNPREIVCITLHKGE